jgi:ArsR family transcriptional regulator
MYRELLALEEEVFKVIANQKRLEIIQLLKNREMNVGEMAAMLGLRQPNLSQHLTLLRQQKLVTVSKRGQKAYYRLADKRIARAVDLVYRFLQAEHDMAPFNPDDIFPIVVDPVCGMRLSASDAFDIAEYAGRTYYFCASGCKRHFVVKPQQYSQVKGVVV